MVEGGIKWYTFEGWGKGQIKWYTFDGVGVQNKVILTFNEISLPLVHLNSNTIVS